MKNRDKLYDLQKKIEEHLKSLNFSQVEGSIDYRHMSSEDGKLQVFNCPPLSKVVVVYQNFPTIGKPQEHGNFVEYHKVAMARMVRGFTEDEITKRNFLKEFKKFMSDLILEANGNE